LGDDAAAFAHLFAGHLPERFSVPANRAEKNHEILDATAKGCACDQPKRAGKVSKLRCEGRADERSGAGDGREVMAEEHPFVGGHEVAAVVVPFRRGCARVVQCQNLGGNKSRIQAECYEITTKRRDHKPHRVERLASVNRDCAESARAKKGDNQPSKDRKNSFHCAGLMLDLRNCAMSAFSFTHEGV
jgi:hypothetical protein